MTQLILNHAYLLLGSNLGDRIYNLERSIVLLSEQVGEILVTSSIYETEPWGTEIPLSFLNMVIKIETNKTPEKLLEQLLLIEKEMGRQRGNKKNMPRTVDIDILFYNSQIVKSEKLVVPHERLHSRRFVLVPLAEIASEYVHPVLEKNIRELLLSCPDESWVKLYNPATPNV